MQTYDTPVLIVGGGLTGLAASALLSLHGVESVLVERHKGTSVHPKARAINPRTTEVLRAIGIEDEVMANRSPIAGNTDLVHVVTLAGAERVRLPRPSQQDMSALTPSGWALIDQNRLEPILLEQVRRNGAGLRYHTELSALEIDDDGVTAVLRDRGTGEQQELRARYLIAADGNRSPVRQLAGVAQHGAGTLTSMVSFMFDADLSAAIGDRRIIAAYVNNEHLRGTLMPLDNRQRWVFNVSYEPEQGEKPEDFTAERCVELIRLGVGDPDLAVELERTPLLPWEIAARCADRLRSGPVFLAGDAAHVMPPTGAFGASAGIQDVHNLAWKLAAVLHGVAGPDLLDTYDSERRPIAELMVSQSMLRFEIREGKPYDAVAGAMLDELVMSFGYRYDGAGGYGIEDPDEPSAEPGARAPHAWLEQGGQRLSTVDLFDRSLVLLTGPQGGAWATAFDAVAAAVGARAASHTVGALGDLVPADDCFARRYRLGAAGAVLVRPDGFVAWRAGALAADPRAELADALTRLLCTTGREAGA
ncbi:FAD-dependent monooxygenase [Dactylosporangium sp. AC04546]|uniref:FAD-dependent monooxygenase n=1 Tax=Dactylosporangium sp. AC04546 TaxID=2862460 RepID=UPI001EDEBBF2|nr:FAD-dependent monooxygenase [Dactylosporangium sp. AC04546]WVK79075.1 FAD-dependent monooxygenase [Dactylosporangium sp. AC04546]